ncbi:uncharacterized protein LOC101851721 [Aplysia californica]|uniref:Uncharacterized protein LOC101851721 n=1 Tax=Aplysia californica TaxID=6500 RepID=A0ABM0JJF9_APLCA|nr:uncharacterized protein LOC101851721 [Aplysia californica]
MNSCTEDNPSHGFPKGSKTATNQKLCALLIWKLLRIAFKQVHPDEHECQCQLCQKNVRFFLLSLLTFHKCKNKQLWSALYPLVDRPCLQDCESEEKKSNEKPYSDNQMFCREDGLDCEPDDRHFPQKTEDGHKVSEYTMKRKGLGEAVVLSFDDFLRKLFGVKCETAAVLSQNLLDRPVFIENTSPQNDMRQNKEWGIDVILQSMQNERITLSVDKPTMSRRSSRSSTSCHSNTSSERSYSSRPTHRECRKRKESPRSRTRRSKRKVSRRRHTHDLKCVVFSPESKITKKEDDDASRHHSRLEQTENKIKHTTYDNKQSLPAQELIDFLNTCVPDEIKGSYEIEFQRKNMSLIQITDSGIENSDGVNSNLSENPRSLTGVDVTAMDGETNLRVSSCPSIAKCGQKSNVESERILSEENVCREENSFSLACSQTSSPICDNNLSDDDESQASSSQTGLDELCLSDDNEEDHDRAKSENSPNDCDDLNPTATLSDRSISRSHASLETDSEDGRECAASCTFPPANVFAVDEISACVACDDGEKTTDNASSVPSEITMDLDLDKSEEGMVHSESDNDNGECKVPNVPSVLNDSGLPHSGGMSLANCSPLQTEEKYVTDVTERNVCDNEEQEADRDAAIEFSPNSNSTLNAIHDTSDTSECSLYPDNACSIPQVSNTKSPDVLSTTADVMYTHGHISEHDTLASVEPMESELMDDGTITSIYHHSHDSENHSKMIPRNTSNLCNYPNHDSGRTGSAGLSNRPFIIETSDLTTDSDSAYSSDYVPSPDCARIPEPMATYAVINTIGATTSGTESIHTDEDNILDDLREPMSDNTPILHTDANTEPEAAQTATDNVSNEDAQNDPDSLAHGSNALARSNNVLNELNLRLDPGVVIDDNVADLFDSQDQADNATETNPQPASQLEPTPEELGIVTSKPKRQEYSYRLHRLSTFTNWPDTHPLKKELMVTAGFFFTGQADCVRCYYCGGGVRNWEVYDHPLVEHARWFPRCGFIQQTVGQPFVNAVRSLRHQDVISFTEVMQLLGTDAQTFEIDPIRRDPAVMILIKEGYEEEAVIQSAREIKENGTSLSSDELFLHLYRQGYRPQHQSNEEGETTPNSGTCDNSENSEQLAQKNSEMRKMLECKVCCTREVQVVFLPCGHCVSCLDCAYVLDSCPLCRGNIGGRVRAFLN